MIDVVADVSLACLQFHEIPSICQTKVMLKLTVTILWVQHIFHIAYIFIFNLILEIMEEIEKFEIIFSYIKFIVRKMFFKEAPILLANNVR